MDEPTSIVTSAADDTDSSHPYGLASPYAGDAILIDPAVRVRRHETPVRSCLHSSSDTPDTGEVLHIRFRTGKANTQRGVIRFVDELVARVRAAGATGPILLRADSDFHNKALRARLAAKGVQYSIGARLTKRVAAAISEIAEDAWQTLTDYPATGQAQIDETTLNGERLIVRRVRPLGKDAQGKLFETWQHHALISNRSDALALVEAEHRATPSSSSRSATSKTKRFAHFPSGQFAANAAWTVIACLAHDLLRWTEQLGLPASTPRRARTHRRRLLALPGRLTRHARISTLHLPARWP
jgi:hypothetical protein